MRCYECGADGHVKSDCPNKAWIASDAAADGRPRWCGTCDERSRHIELADGRVKRCQCHPESHMQLTQHRKCPSCRKTVVTWDTSTDCELHILAGAQRPYIGHANSPGGHELAAACPWCDSPAGQACQNTALGTIKPRSHEARYQAAKLSVPGSALAEEARRQVDESRANDARLSGAYPAAPHTPTPA